MLSAVTRAASGVMRSLVAVAVAVAVAFGVAGAVLGGVSGTLTGFVDDEGLMQGALVGAITGALVAVELADSVVRIWCCDDCSVDTRSELLQRLVLRSLVGSGLLRGSVFPTISSALDSQIDALQPRQGAGDLRDMYVEPSYPVMATRRAVVGNLPATRLTKETAAQLQSACPICLHEFQADESARRLPVCRHVFHLVCIDGWLLWNPQCPMCRRPVY